MPETSILRLLRTPNASSQSKGQGTMSLDVHRQQKDEASTEKGGKERERGGEQRERNRERGTERETERFLLFVLARLQVGFVT